MQHAAQQGCSEKVASLVSVRLGWRVSGVWLLDLLRAPCPAVFYICSSR